MGGIHDVRELTIAELDEAGGGIVPVVVAATLFGASAAFLGFAIGAAVYTWYTS
jgi:hypothetical protein